MSRPESVHLEAATDADQSGFTGKILRSTYLGTQIEYVVDIDGHAVVAVHHDPSERDLLAEGSRAALSLIEENLYLLADEEVEEIE